MLSAPVKWLAVGLALGLVFSFLCLPGGWLHGLELRAGDILFRLRAPRPGPQDVVIVAIDDKSIGQLGRWPWPRARHAELIRSLARAKPRAIAFDVLFSEPSPDDGDLARATHDAACVLYAAQVSPQAAGAPMASSTPKTSVDPQIVIHQDRLACAPAVVLPQPVLTEAAAGIGVAALRADPDGALRRAVLLVAEERSGLLYATFPLAVTARAMHSDVSQMRFDLAHRAVFPSGQVIPLDEEGSALVNFAPGDHPFPRVSFVDALRGVAPVDAFRNKIVLVGFTAGGLRDIYPTSVSSGMPGVEIHAHIVNSLLHGAFARSADRRTFIGITVLLGMLAAGVAGGLRPLAGAGVVLLLAAAFLLGALRLLTTAAYLLPVAAPLLAMAGASGAVSVSRLATEEAGRRRLRDEFRRYAPPEVVARLDAGILQQRLAGTLRPVSLLFADIRGFSELAASTEPTKTVALLNHYFEAMTDVAFDLEGTVDNIVGDEVLITFNAMGDQHDHVQRVVHLAVNMVAELDRLNAQWVPNGDLKEPLRIGIGIHTGEVVVGNVGSHIRTQYTVIGQVVNLASRLEKLNKELGTTMLATGEVIAGIGRRFEVRPIGRLEVRGHPDLVDVYEIIGRSGDEVAAGEQAQTGNGQVSNDGGRDL